MAVILSHSQYGKAEVRLVRVTRHDEVHHDITDVNVTTQLYGDFAECHRTGDNANLIATDTQKNTVYALARTHNVGAIEDFGQLLIAHFVAELESVHGGHAIIEQYEWDRIVVDGQPHPHSFSRTGGQVRTAAVTVDGDQVWITAGIEDLVVMKTTGSEFHGFPRTQFTTLAETTDRVLATALTCRWRYNTTDVDWDTTFASVRRTLLETFAGRHSFALQQTEFAMAEAVIEAHPTIDEVRLTMPNKHHFLVDLSPFGVENPGEVFIAADRPYGLIEATVIRDDASDAGSAWHAVPGFV